MITKLARHGKIYAFLPFLIPEDNPYDRVSVGKQKVKDDETGWDRLRALFQKHQDYTFHPKLVSLLHTSIGTFIIGGVIGAIKTSRNTFINFIENNEATQFESHLQAKRQLSDKMFTSFIKGGTAMGLKISFFCTCFMIPYVVISTYRDKDAFWYYSVGGAYAGAIYKFPLGPKGMISGGVFGCFFGTVYGAFHSLILKLMAESEKQFQESIFQKKLEREEAFSQAFKNMRKAEIRKDFEEEMKRIK